MAFEERIISFYPDEVHEALIKNIDKLAPDVQKNIKKNVRKTERKKREKKKREKNVKKT